MKYAYKILSLILCFIFTLGLISCDKEEPCKHEYVWNSVTLPTCTNEGLDLGTCKFCSNLTTLTIPKSNMHNYAWTETKIASCKEVGLKTGTCTLCNSTTTEEIPKTNNHNYYWEQIEAPTCIKTGISKGICLDCLNETSKPIDFAEHTYNWTITKQPTSCTEDGEETGICTICQHSITRPLSGHDYKWTIIKEPTCNELGEESGVCSICLDKKYRAIELIEHDYNYTILKESSCLETGLSADVCSVCNATKNLLTINKKSHSFDGVFCSVCETPNSNSTIPTNFTGGITVEEISDRLSEYDMTIGILGYVDINSIILSANNKVTIAYTYKNHDLFLPIDNLKAEFNIQNNTNVISKITVEKYYPSDWSYELNAYAIYSNGTKIYIGTLYNIRIDSNTYVEIVNDSNKLINRIFINQNNQLVAVYKNNFVINLGTIQKETYTQEYDDNLIYQKINETAYTVCGINNPLCEDIIIPETYNGLPITHIDDYAFEGYINIKSVTIGKNVKKIGNWAFWKCSNLSKLYIPNINLKINDGAFYKTNLSNIYFEGSLLDRSKIIISNNQKYNDFNDLLFTDIWNYNYSK